MTTKRQIKRIFDLIQSEHVDLSQFEDKHGCYLVLTPIRHVIRSITMLGTSDPDAPRVYYGIGYAWYHPARLQGLWFDQFHCGAGTPTRWSEPDFIRSTIDLIGTRLLPMLREVDRIESVLSFRHAGTSQFQRALNDPVHRVHLLVGAGRLDEALEYCSWLAEHRRDSGLWSEHDHARLVDDMMPLLLRRDRAMLGRLLAEWEAKAVRELGVEGVYEQSSFSFEVPSPA